MWVLPIVFLSGGPISLRKLCLLFVGLSISATCVFEMPGIKEAVSRAFITASSLTFLVWILPLLCVLYDSFCARALSLTALSRVSPFVLWTYGVVLAATPLLAIGLTLNPDGHITGTMFVRLTVISCVIGIIVPVGITGSASKRATIGSTHPIRPRARPMADLAFPAYRLDLQ
jgi:hypothetical protein